MDKPTNKNLFAPPTPQELGVAPASAPKANNLFAPPSEEEKKRAMFAPPSTEELAAPTFGQELEGKEPDSIQKEIEQRSFFDKPVTGAE